MGDRVSKPKQTSRSGGLKQVNSSIIKGPTQTVQNATPYNRKSK
jgi:hypothetical protein